MPENPFWNFSLAVYAADGVSDACLRLQDKRGFDVNLLLFSCWAGCCHDVAASESEWRSLIDSTRIWREEVIWPLRRARRALKTARLEGALKNHEDLRRAVQQIELDCERAQQDFLASKLESRPTFDGGNSKVTADKAAGNAENLGAAMGVSLDASDHADIRCILDAAVKIRP